MRQETTAKEVLKLYQQAVAARQRIRTQYASGKHKTATRAIRELKIFDTYGRASCRYMCQKILISLPPELCDMIIERVIGHSRKGVAAGGTCEPIYAYDDYHPPAHYWKVEYVGKPMLARMMAVWYRINSFNIRWHLVDLRRFLNEDAPCIHSPRYKLITKICIVVSPDFLAFDPKKDRPGNILFRMYSPRSWEEQIRDLELLFQLRTGASILILLDYMDTQVIPDDGQNALLLEGTATMIECLCRLRKAGYVVGASIAGFGNYRGLVDELEYRLEEMDALEQETNCLPVNVTGMAWRSMSKASTSTPLQNAVMTTVSVVSSGNWRIEAKRTINSIARLSEAFHDKAARLDKMKKATPKARLTREKQAVRKAGGDLRLAQTSFTDQVEAQAKAICRPFCEAVHERLPQELRDIIARYLLIENSATFLSSKDDKISFVNGLSILQHAFEEEYTGIGLHMDIISELINQNARFDFRVRHELLGKVFKHYAADERGGLDLACKMRRLSLVVTEHHLEDREVVHARLEELCKLSKGAKIFIIIETGHGTKAQTVRQVRRVLRVFFELLKRLHKLGLHNHIVVNPAYSASQVKNDSDDTFSVMHEGSWRYVMTPENATFTVEGFETRLRYLFGTYGEHWDSRSPPHDG